MPSYFHGAKVLPFGRPPSAFSGAFLSQEDKQVGGLPMALGRAATPYGGGRVIRLFAHKKYDFVTLEYFDSNAAFTERSTN